ncbi:tRNA synthetases class I-domain-containing protein [Podospora fimiseda]|uniref:Tyrosine--tRNA ligase n=1 Tax=Podospora fimiseda TaxID=252190 RepID=A0AAN7BS85_9PEZI|nr:tRNA synthetases class I-domain-containing protein [Podospora fimiseda]
MVLGSGLLSNRGSICRRCLLTAEVLVRGPSYVQNRGIRTYGLKYTKKLDDAAAEWAKRAELIKKGKLQNTFDMLEERGYIKDIAGSKETLRELYRVKRVGAYVGIDPTADSLHVGHLLPLMPLFWMYMNGYKAFSLIGGATVKVGDPTGRLKSRDPITPSDLTMNMTKMHYQVKKLWVNVEDIARYHGYEKDWAWRRALVNNNTWWNALPMLDVLKRIGHSVRIGPMLSRDTVKNKMEIGDGVSFAEFTYPIMQGWDWWTMFQANDIQLQIGGSDQYGNIVAGMDIVKAARDNEPHPAKKIPRWSELDDPYGFTVPLLTDGSGVKFGKSAGNAVWLDKFKTSVFDFYGYFVRKPDSEMEQLLKLFTFQPLDKIKEVMTKHVEKPEERHAQHFLAFEVTRLVHGVADANAAQLEHRTMYGKRSFQTLPVDQYAAADSQTTLNNAPRIDMILPKSLIMGKSISRILYAAGLVKSTSEGQRVAVQKAAYIGGMPGGKREMTPEARAMNPAALTFTPVQLWYPQDTQNYLIDGKILILRRGKHNIRVIEVVSDEEYEKSGQSYPGQPYTGAVRQLHQQLLRLKRGEASVDEVKTYLGKDAEETDAAAPMIKFPDQKNRHTRNLEYRIEQLLTKKEAEEAKKLVLKDVEEGDESKKDPTKDQ